MGTKDPPSRTGFLEYVFTNGDRAEIHTHWNVNKKKIVSIHIKLAGVNGMEINSFGKFDLVSAAVRDAHNAATGSRVPTTVPAGGSLTL